MNINVSPLLHFNLVCFMENPFDLPSSMASRDFNRILKIQFEIEKPNSENSFKRQQWSFLLFTRGKKPVLLGSEELHALLVARPRAVVNQEVAVLRALRFHVHNPLASAVRQPEEELTNRLTLLHALEGVIDRPLLVHVRVCEKKRKVQTRARTSDPRVRMP